MTRILHQTMDQSQEISLPDKYVRLMERSLKENEELRKAIIQRDQEQKELLKRLLDAQETAEERPAKRRRCNQKLVVPQLCKVIVKLFTCLNAKIINVFLFLIASKASTAFFAPFTQDAITSNLGFCLICSIFAAVSMFFVRLFYRKCIFKQMLGFSCFVF